MLNLFICNSSELLVLPMYFLPSYLSHGSQVLAMKWTRFYPTYASCGVSQVVFHVPLLFLINANDIPLNIKAFLSLQMTLPCFIQVRVLITFPTF